MASTDSFPDADPPRRGWRSKRGAKRRALRGARPPEKAANADVNVNDIIDSEAEDHVVSSSSNESQPKPRNSRRASRLKRRKQQALAAMDKGWPDWDGLKPIVSFLVFPAIFAMLIVATGGGWPKAVLYPVAAVFAVYVGLSAFTGVELVLACLLLYLPFSTSYVIPIAPGVNGTNMLLLLGLFASFMSAGANRQTLLPWPPGTGLVVAYGFLSGISGFTIMALPGGLEYLLYHELLSYKAWLDQFLFYYIAMCAVRDIDTAKRVVLYMCIGAILMVLYAVPEMLEKMGRSSIEKSRIEGPQKQSNNFGGFVAYTVLPIAALFLTYIKDYRAWVITPYFFIAAKVLISTFSRGAYLAMATGALLATYYKGKGFLIMVGTLAIVMLMVFPVLIPESILVRMGQITAHSPADGIGTEKKLDKSSSHRLILWRAAAKMTLEDPILGKGFKGFQALKSLYTESPVREADPHNMYLYIASQMGLPALVMFLLILAYSFFLGRSLAQNKEDLFIRAIGMGGASATACVAVICLFGSRAVNLEFTAYFWAYLACMQVIKMQLKEAADAAKPKKRRGRAVNQNQRGESQGEPAAPLNEPLPAGPAPKLLGAPHRRLRRNKPLATKSRRKR